MVVPFLNIPIPIISVVMMLLAGILIGNLIWYRDRSEDEALLVGLRGENQELQAALHEHKQAYVELEADLDDRCKESDQLKAVLRQLDLARQEAEQETNELNSELVRLQQLKDQAFHDLDQERQQRRALQETLAQHENHAARAEQVMQQLQSQLDGFQQERDELDKLAHDRAAEKVELEAEIASLQRDGDELTTRFDHATATIQQQQEELQATQQRLQQTQQDLDARNDELESLRCDRTDLSQQVDDERLAREQLAEKIRQVEQLVSQRDHALERATTAEATKSELEQKLADMEESFRQNRTRSLEELSSISDENEELSRRLATLTKEHEAVTTMLVDERTRLSKMEADNHHLSLLAAEQSEQTDQLMANLRQQVDTQVDELNTLRHELETTAAHLSRERHQREHLQHVLDQRQVTIHTLERERDQLSESITTLNLRSERMSQDVDELQSLRGEHESVKRILTDTTRQLHAARRTQQDAVQRNQDLVRQKRELEVEVEQLASQLSDQELVRMALVKTEEKLEALQTQAANGLLERQALEDQVDEMTQRVAQVAAVGEEYDVQLSELQKTHETVLAERRELEVRVEALTEEVAHWQQLRVDFDELKRTHREQQERLRKLIAQRDEAMASSAAAEESIRGLRSQLESQSRALSALHQQLEQWKSKQRDDEDLRAQNELLVAATHESKDQLRSIAAQRDQAREKMETLSRRLDQMEVRAKANEQTIRNLRRERQEVIARSRQATVAASVPFAPASVQDSGGRLRRDDVLGLVYTQPPKRKDDLKRITGIAQVLEKKLNAFGVYTYRQIMEWDDVAVAEFSKLLSFRDRIARDDWVGQARNLQYETYGRAA